MVVIIGAGICGAATAYYLAKENPSIVATAGITLIDAVGPAAGSSGKAGAFLTESSWKSSKTKLLHEKAFSLHKELADELQLDSFRELPSAYHYYAVDNGNDDEKSNYNSNNKLQISDGFDIKPIAGRCAQVDPAELTNALLDATIQLGAKLEIDTVENLSLTTATDEDGNGGAECRIVESVQLASGKNLHVVDQDVVIALGPWSCRVEDWLGIPTPLDGVLSTSMIWEDAIDNWNLHNNALFSQAGDDMQGCHLEIIPRLADRSVYVSGCGGSQVINPAVFRGPDRPTPGSEEPDRSRIPYVRQSLSDLFGISHEESRDPDEIRACIRPNSPDGIPLVGQLLENCYVATGGGPWGITYGPIIGQSVARMILDDTDNIPIRSSLWNPRRFDTMVYRSLMQQRGQQQRQEK